MRIEQEAAIAAQRAAYGEKFGTHGDTPGGTGQNDRSTQYLRFDRILAPILPYLGDGSTIHDLGSGLADFYGFLRARGLDTTVTYSGTEVVEEMNEAARSKYPGLQLSNRNFLDLSVGDRYDFCIASGTFNLLSGLHEDAWRKLCFDLIGAMYERADKGIVFNVLTSYRTFTDETLCYFDPREVFDFATTKLSRFVSVDAGYPLFEATVTVLKKEFAANLFPDPAFAKYFR